MNFERYVTLRESNNNTFQMYHGGNKWFGQPEIRASKKGQYEGGIGLYFTTNYETARTYAKGGKVVTKVHIDKQFKNIDNVDISVNDIIDFLMSLPRLKNKKEIIDRINAYSERLKSTNISASTLNNLIVNYEAGSGDNGVKVNQFLVHHGVDAEIQSKSNEDWLVVFNTSIIKDHEIVNVKKLSVDDYNLPLIRNL